MAYSELVKNFNRIRDYMREFYVYGFKSRGEYDRKSARSYDDERRRVESWLGDYMRFHRTPDKKNVFLSIDSRVTRHNPLYKAWKAKSFTDGDITLHFILMDILSVSEKPLPLSEIMQQIDIYLSGFAEPRMFDESTIRKKLKEYVSEGVVRMQKQGKTVCYIREQTENICDPDMLDFFSEAAPCGVIGSFLLDKCGNHEDHFAFKHHYITGALDSEVLCGIFMAMREKRAVILKLVHRKSSRIFDNYVVPLRVMVSVQNGRQYLMAYTPEFHKISPFRIDRIVSVKSDTVSQNFDELREKLDRMQTHMWGVGTQNRSGQQLEHVEFTVHYEDDEQYIHRRMVREKRCGTVEKLDAHTSRFCADIYDAREMIPWIRTFICRITEIHFSDPNLEMEFKKDLQKMYELYGLEGGDSA